MCAVPATAEPRGRPTRRTALLAAMVGATAAGCTATLDNPPGTLRLATGPPGAVYREVGTALARVLDQRLSHTRVDTIATDASVENLRLLTAARTELAIAQLDATLAGPTSARPGRISAVARLFDSWLHLVVRADGPIRHVADLDGRRVAAGAPQSGTQFTVRRLLGLLPDVRPELVNLTQADEADRFRTGRIDAFFTLTGVPTPAVSTLAEEVPIRLVSLAGFAERLNQRHGGDYPPYRSAVLPSSVYPGIPATETVTVANLLLARDDLTANLVEVVTATLFAERARIAQGHPEARSINMRTGIATGPIPLHPGARRYFRAHKQ